MKTEKNINIRNILPILFVAFGLFAANSYNYALANTFTRVSSQTNKILELQNHIDSLMLQEPLKSSLFGFKAFLPSGEVIADFNGKQKLIPASNMKLITSGIALRELGADFRFETSLAYNGVIQNGVLKGDLYILGGADPTLASHDGVGTSQDELFANWKRILESAGINRIKGMIIGDGRFFDGEIECNAWEYSDVGTYYGTGGEGLAFYENVKDIPVQAGENIGAPVKIMDGYPETPWLKLISTCRTAEAGSGDKLYLYTNDIAPIADMRGTFAIDRKPKTEYCANKFPSLTCAYLFSKYLNENGISVGKKSVANAAYVNAAYVNAMGSLTLWSNKNDFDELNKNIIYSIRNEAGIFAVTNIKAANYDCNEPKDMNHMDDMTLIGSTYSAKLVDILKELNHRSDNFYAETLFRYLGKIYSGSSEYIPSREVEYKLLNELGIDTAAGINIKDGSGLSRGNYISPDFFCHFLRAMSVEPCFDDYLKSLPSPGSANSTLTYMLRAATPEQKSRIYMKSGSLGGVRCFSGYIFPSAPSEYLNSKEASLNSNQINSCSHDEPIVFSLLINNYDVPTSRINKIIETILLQLLEY